MLPERRPRGMVGMRALYASIVYGMDVRPHNRFAGASARCADLALTCNAPRHRLHCTWYPRRLAPRRSGYEETCVRNVPNYLSLGRLLLTIPLVVLILVNTPTAFLVATGLFFV